MHRDFILRIICIDPTCTELHLYRGDGDHLAYHEIDFGQISAQDAYALFDLPGFLRQCSDAAACATAVARVGVLLATRILGPQIMPLLYADPAPRTLLIDLPIASPQPLAQMPWDLARPSHGQPTLCERNLRMVFKYPKSVPAAACLARLPHQPLRILMIFSDAAQGLPDALRQERRALLALFARQVFPHRQVVVHTLAHRLARSKLVAYLREHDGFHILHFSLYGAEADGAGQAGHSALPRATDWADWFREAGVGLPQFVYLAHGVGDEQAAQRNWRDFFAAGQSALPPPTTNGLNWASHAAHLIQAGVPCVLTLRFAVREEYGTQLALGFYQALLADAAPKSVAAALGHARKRLPAASDEDGALLAKRFSASDHAAALVYGEDQHDLVGPSGRSPHGTVQQRWLPLLAQLQPQRDFVGRTQPLTRMASEWLAPNAGVGIVQLLGPRGIGKTALAAEALDLWQHAFRWIVPFSCVPHLLTWEALFFELHQRLLAEQGEYWRFVRAHPGKAIYLPPDADFHGAFRRQHLSDNLMRALQDEAILLVFDQFEAQLAPGDGAAAARALVAADHSVPRPAGQPLADQRRCLAAHPVGFAPVLTG